VCVCVCVCVCAQVCVRLHRPMLASACVFALACVPLRPLAHMYTRSCCLLVFACQESFERIEEEEGVRVGRGSRQWPSMPASLPALVALTLVALTLLRPYTGRQWPSMPASHTGISTKKQPSKRSATEPSKPQVCQRMQASLPQV
jgi:hypothetical protein